MHEFQGGSDFRLNDGPGIKLSSVGHAVPDVRLWQDTLWLSLGFSLVLTVCVLIAPFFVSLQCILIFSCDDTLDK